MTSQSRAEQSDWRPFLKNWNMRACLSSWSWLDMIKLEPEWSDVRTTQIGHSSCLPSMLMDGLTLERFYKMVAKPIMNRKASVV
eukprot:5355973-Amphidinium_carterae.1